MYERPLTTKIIEELNSFRNSVPDEGLEDSKWTAGVKNALLRAGRHFGYEIYANHQCRHSPGQAAAGV